MNKTIFNLAIENIKSNKKHYVIVSIITFIASLFMFGFMMINDNQYQLEKEFNEDKYGSWYVRISNIDEMSKKLLENYISDMKKDLRKDLKYGYIRYQGKIKDYSIASLDDEIYDLYRISFLDGQKMINDNEILVSKKYSQRECIYVGDHVLLNKQFYKVVGIVESQNENLPDIITQQKDFISLDYYSNMELPRHVKKGYSCLMYKDEEGKKNEWYLSYEYNPYGYDHNIRNSKGNVASQYAYFYTKIGICICFLLFVLTSSSLRKRTKEMALLRGIGMTTWQMIDMVIIEHFLTCVLSMISGIFASIGISGVFMYYQSFYYHYFIFSINLPLLVLSMIIFMFFIFISIILPIYSSSQSALSGSFDSYQFKYIQVRYKKLHKQSLNYLSLRELIVNKKMNISFFIFVLVISMYGIAGLYKKHPMFITNNNTQKYTEVFFDNPQDIHNFYDYFQDNTVIFPYTHIEMGIQAKIQNLKTQFYEIGKYDKQFINEDNIEGRIPQNSHELIVGKGNMITLTNDDYQDISINESLATINGKEYNSKDFCIENSQGLETITSVTIQIDQMKIGEKIELNDEEYSIVGIYDMDNLSIAAPPLLLLYDLDFNNLTKETVLYYGQHHFSPVEINEVRYFFIKYNIDEDNYYIDDSDVIMIDYNDFELSIGTISLIFLFGSILMIFLNYNHIENNYRDYQLYHILGMSYDEIKKKQLWKVIYMFIFTVIPVLLFFMIYIVNSFDHYIPIFQMVCMIIFIYIFYYIIYQIPIHIVLYHHRKRSEN